MIWIHLFFLFSHALSQQSPNHKWSKVQKRGLLKKVIGTAMGVGAGVLGYKALKKGFNTATGRDSSQRLVHYDKHHFMPYPPHQAPSQHACEPPCSVKMPPLETIVHQPIEAVQHNRHYHEHHHFNIKPPHHPEIEHAEIVEAHHHMIEPQPPQIPSVIATDIDTTVCIDHSNECSNYVTYCVKTKIRALCRKTCGYC